MKNLKIAVIGLGYVGLPLARLFSTKYPTVGFDMNQSRVDALMQGHDATLEVDDALLQEAVEAAKGADLIESWEIGAIEKDAFISQRRFQRSFQYPALVDSLAIGAGRMPDLLLTDAAGTRRAYQWRDE